jgi:hypothetical protein
MEHAPPKGWYPTPSYKTAWCHKPEGYNLNYYYYYYYYYYYVQQIKDRSEQHA